MQTTKSKILSGVASVGKSKILFSVAAATMILLLVTFNTLLHLGLRSVAAGWMQGNTISCTSCGHSLYEGLDKVAIECIKADQAHNSELLQASFFQSFSGTILGHGLMVFGILSYTFQDLVSEDGQLVKLINLVVLLVAYVVQMSAVFGLPELSGPALWNGMEPAEMGLVLGESCQSQNPWVREFEERLAATGEFCSNINMASIVFVCVASSVALCRQKPADHIKQEDEA